MAVVVCAGFCVGVDSYGAGPTEIYGFSQVEKRTNQKGCLFQETCQEKSIVHRRETPFVQYR